MTGDRQRDDEHRRRVQDAVTITRWPVGTWLSTVGSAIALIVSGISMWETVLKQPQLKVFVGDSIFYTRDPWGSYEVFVVPITIVNSGAQDGAVVALKLDLANTANGAKDTFDSAYTADATWFSGSDNVTTRSKRPKAPFSALSIAGRSAWSGTVLFYSPEYRKEKVAEPKSTLTGTLKLTVPGPDGWLDRTLVRIPRDIPVKLEVPNYLPGALLSGDVARVRVSFGTGPKASTPTTTK